MSGLECGVRAAIIPFAGVADKFGESGILLIWNCSGTAAQTDSGVAVNILIIGASRGLGKAFVEGLGTEGDRVIGVSRRRPEGLRPPAGLALDWIEADLSDPAQAVRQVVSALPERLDVVMCNVGVWEREAFEPSYAFSRCSDQELLDVVQVNIASTILLLKHVLPRMSGAAKPQLFLTGSTSGLSRSGRPEVAFAASKFALSGMADALREEYRAQRLAVTCLQLGYLNTEDDLSVPREQAAERGAGQLIPLHDVVSLARAVLNLSDASFAREIVLPAILDERF